MAEIDMHLGKVSQYESKYNPELLVRESRDTNRKAHNVDIDAFVGYDVWNMYEISFLTDNGLPVVGFGKLVYSAYSPYIVESKSLKLYLFSYNMEKLGATINEAIDTVTQQVIIDLSALLETVVEFKFFHANVIYNPPYRTFTFDGKGQILCSFDQIDSIFGLEDIVFTDFVENPNLLKIGEYNETEMWTAFTSSMLRSNCKITHQPDWGDVYVYYRGHLHLDRKSFIQYIVSFRNENHFHEEVVEMIYMALLNILDPIELMVAAHYTRRGGIDINPIRASHARLLDKGMIDVNVVVEKTARQ